jgi:hypothetical protein
MSAERPDAKINLGKKELAEPAKFSNSGEPITSKKHPASLVWDLK